MPTRSSPWRLLVGDLSPTASALVLGCAAVAAATTWTSTRARTGRGVAALSAVVAFDLVGGLVAFQLPGTRRRYAATSTGDRLRLAAIHVQPYALPMTEQGSWSTATARHLAALGGTALLERSRLSPGARRLVAGGLGVALTGLDIVRARGEHQRWLGPVFLVKLIGGHAGIPRDTRASQADPAPSPARPQSQPPRGRRGASASRRPR